MGQLFSFFGMQCAKQKSLRHYLSMASFKSSCDFFQTDFPKSGLGELISSNNPK